MVDGSVSPIVGKGSIFVSNLILNSVLHASNWSCNLLSISKITHDMN